MARPATDDEADLRPARRPPGDDPRRGQPDDVGVGGNEPLEHLVDRVERIVDQLLEHARASSAQLASPAASAIAEAQPLRVWPPSIARTAPVVNVSSGSHKATTQRAMSSGWAMIPSGEAPRRAT